MANRITLSAKFLTVNGKRVGITLTGGPWNAGVDPNTIKIRPKKTHFPAEVRKALEIENNSDMMTDYFESDCIRVLPGHSLYEQARKLVDAAEAASRAKHQAEQAAIRAESDQIKSDQAAEVKQIREAGDALAAYWAGSATESILRHYKNGTVH